MVEFIETTTFSVAVISTGSMTTAIYTFGTAPTSFVFTKLAKSNYLLALITAWARVKPGGLPCEFYSRKTREICYLLDLITAWAPASLAAGTRNGEHDT